MIFIDFNYRLEVEI